MNNMKVGIFIDQNHRPANGGSFSYFNTLIKEVQNFHFDDDIEIINILIGKQNSKHLDLVHKTLIIDAFIPSQNSDKTSIKIRSVYASIRTNFVARYFARKFQSRQHHLIEEAIKNENIDILLYLTPYVLLPNFPYAVVNWDLGHKSTYAFPEVSMNGNYEHREKEIAKSLNKALLILCESEAGKKEVIKYFNIAEQKIRVFPIFGNSALETPIEGTPVESDLGFDPWKEDFFLYPAQFWALKNHYNLVLAFKKFSESHNNVKLVLCGSDKGNLEYIKSVISDLELNDRVVITGFVTDDTLISLYQNTIALVYPAFLGPTNMPLIEAANLKCPIICTDLEGHREILEENALFISPIDVDDISNALVRMYIDKELRSRLIKEGYQHIKCTKFNTSSALSRLNQYLKEIKSIRKTWGNSY